MAKKAKEAAVDINERTANKFVRDILERYSNIESAKGRYMLASRREREGMKTIYESFAQRGISQRVAKMHISLIQLMARARGLLSDLEAEDRKTALKLAKLQGDKQQLGLFDGLKKLPPEEKAPKVVREAETLEERVPQGEA